MVLHENKAMGGALLNPDDWPAFDACFNKDPQRSDIAVPMAITVSSDGEDRKGYDRAMALWGATGAKGESPNRREFARPRTTLPNTINLCKWNLDLQRDSGWPKIDEGLIASAQDFTFLQGLQNNNRAINKLSETMGATLLHEVDAFSRDRFQVAFSRNSANFSTVDSH